MYLNLDQIHEFVSANTYPVSPKSRFLSRCIDGRYQPVDDLPALAIPGADPGDLAVFLAAANSYGFSIDRQKALEVLIETVGGVTNLKTHTDSHGDPELIASGCGHLKQIRQDPSAYSLTQDDIDFLTESFTRVVKKGAEEVKLEGGHQEGAVLLVTGSYGVYSRSRVRTDMVHKETQIFVYHSSLVDLRHRAIADSLVAKKAVVLPKGCGSEYLYEIISNVTEEHLFETAGRLAKGLPIFSASFDEEGTLKIEFVENIQ